MMKDSKTKKTIAITKLTYQKLPFYFRWLFYPVKFIYRLAHKLRIDIWIISGKEHLNTPLTIIFAGCERNKNYFAKLAFDSSYSEIHIGKKWLWNLFRIVSKGAQDYSLIVLEMDRAFYRLFNSKKSFFIPCWIGGEVDISGDISSLIKTDSHKTDIRRIKKYNMQFEVTNEQSQFDNFYNHMYLPYITNAHRNTAFPVTDSDMKKNFKNCDLLLIKKEKEYIGGVLLIYRKSVPCIWSFGVKDGNTDYLKAGVIGAQCYFAVVYLKEKGYKKMHFGGSRAFLKDGVLQYKKERGLQVMGSPRKGFLVKPLSNSAGTKGFFLRNPFIYLNKSKLIGAVFVENDQLSSEKDFEKIYKDFYIKGLSRLNIYLFGENERNIREIIPSKYLDKMSICSAERLFQK